MSNTRNNRTISVNSREAQILHRIRELNLNNKEIELLSDKTVASALIGKLRNYLRKRQIDEASQTRGNSKKFVHDLERSTETLPNKSDAASRQNEFTVTWEEVTEDCDWDEIYPGVELLTINQVSEILDISSDDVTTLVRDGKVLALGQGGRRDIRFPKEQFVRDRSIDGIARILAIFDNHDFAWGYLSTPVQLESRWVKPIDVLKSENRKNIDFVISNAAGFGSDFT